MGIRIVKRSSGWAVQLADCLGQGLARVEEMRQAEGDPLVGYGRCRSLLDQRRGKDIAAGTSNRQPQPASLCAQRIKSRDEELVYVWIPNRLAQEAALLAERAVIGEELAAQLHNHTRAILRRLLDKERVNGQEGAQFPFAGDGSAKPKVTLLSKTPGLGEEGSSYLPILDTQIKADIRENFASKVRRRMICPTLTITLKFNPILSQDIDYFQALPGRGKSTLITQRLHHLPDPDVLGLNVLRGAGAGPEKPWKVPL